MSIRLVFIGLLFIVSTAVDAKERLMINFELMENKTMIEQGSVLVTKKLKGWNKGMQTSYLKLACKPLANGKVEKLYSTINFFDGLKVTHQQVGDTIELMVKRSKVTSRFTEIHNLPANQCKDMVPVLTTTVETYQFGIKKGIKDSRPFGDSMTFHYHVN
ncbi:hypothetical protein [Colwellia ponticola]|uniref:Uncharacterized protein n=1 Tax=Colwellia ponticola TaxID=2304625 RepID=A0A8H2PP74_9GAMM|nr:hypothetical protein [Colwellia ponticola]TMM47715.1 hypothetical protein FCS21_01705 [Colwellia ponticola]